MSDLDLVEREYVRHLPPLDRQAREQRAIELEDLVQQGRVEGDRADVADRTTRLRRAQGLAAKPIAVTGCNSQSVEALMPRLPLGGSPTCESS